jgi:hypothetical protein
MSNRRKFLKMKKIMTEKHPLRCEAPICQDDPNESYKDEVIWYPGEKICSKVPYQEFQKKQIEINILVKKGRFKNVDRPYTANDLETKLI